MDQRSLDCQEEKPGGYPIRSDVIFSGKQLREHRTRSAPGKVSIAMICLD
jgi:hypothetical protein